MDATLPADLTMLAHQLDAKKGTCRAIIETPKGSRNKFDYDPESNLFMPGGVLPEGMMFPFDFGFIPSTLADNGDPVDILVIMDAPAHVGCLIHVRLIGVISAEQIEDGKRETNDRLLGVSIHSYDHESIASIDDVSKTLLSQLEEFFITYNKQRGKKFRVIGTGGPRKAIKFLQAASKNHKASQKE
jgi:inorganic pyrophosphatase